MRCPPAVLLIFATGCGQDPLVPESPAGDPVTGFRIAPVATNHLLLGRAVQIRVGASRRSGASVTIDGLVSYRSTAPLLLRVDAAGNVTADGAGAAHVVATATIEGRAFADSVRLVGVDPGFTLQLEPSNWGGLLLGQTAQVRLTARTPVGNPIPLPGPARYRSTAPTVMSVDSAGTVTALAMGSAHIVGELATTHGTLADSIRVAVYCTLELRSDYDPPPEPLRTGSSFPLRARLTTCSGQVAIPDPQTWHTSDSTIVSIDRTGPTATALRPGNAAIWVTTERFPAFGVMPVRVVP